MLRSLVGSEMCIRDSYLSASNANHRQPTPTTTTNDSFATLSLKSEGSGHVNAKAQQDDVHLRPLSAFALHQAAGSRSPASPSPYPGDRPRGHKQRRSGRTVRIAEEEPQRDLRASQMRIDGRPTLDAAVAELHASYRSNRSRSPCQH
eukprot:TRINITY_DN31292_c0_g1_i1.p1 TRINITY_DN31292_c0_g1~~TRINITY_DN31292_c0_g1_i1.p1  ORF type:complete len:167 (-),score=27.30 TRINITY_DN31292_c0_g1_i1:103-546(-)